jgi:predicted ATPase/class 3 adenylate cyclase
VLLTDLVDSTRLHERLGEAAARELWAAHDTEARALLRQWRGREVGRSDGLLAVFETCDDALAYAFDYRRALAALSPPVQARIGIHWGAAALRLNSQADVAGGATPHELDGLALPVAARVMSAAAGGQILLSASASGALSAAALQGRRRHSHGHWRLKGLQEPVELVEVAGADAACTPPPDAAKAYRVTWREDHWTPVAELPNNLGREPDPFVGRDDALQALAQALEEGARLVTVLGMGGIGKTRLVQRYARGWLGGYPGGAWFCDLSAARSLDGIVHAVAQTLGVPPAQSEPVQQLGRALAGRGECLLILDNFEQVSRWAGPTLGHWMAAAPQVRFIATSREVLGIAGEQVQVLAPLSDAAARQLFIARMQAAGMESPLDAVDAAALPALVEQLDCLPLAIELAAARARVVPPADQVRRMGERFRLLVGRGGRHDRQATMRAALDGSWDLLSAEEQRALAALSVFEGGFTLDAAAAVIGPVTQGPWPEDLVQSLVEKSLLRRLHARRFGLLRTVQDYAAEKLDDGQVVARHWQYFAALSESEAVRERCVEIDNVVAACRRATQASPAAPGAPDSGATAGAVGALGNVWAALRLVGPFRAALELAAPLAERADLSAAQRAHVLRVQGGAAGLTGQADEARRLYEQGLALAHEGGDKGLQALLQALLGDLDVVQGRFDAAGPALEAALAAAREHPVAQLTALNALGNLAQARADRRRAAAHYGEGLKLAEALGDRRWQGGLHGSLGTVALMEGALLQARDHLRQGLALATEAGDRQWAGNAHCNLGLLLHELGEHEAAHQELLAALQLANDMGHRRLRATSLCNLGLVLRALHKPAQALEHLEQAVAAARELRSQDMEGQFLGYWGETLAASGHAARAREVLAAARGLLASHGNTPSRALLACQCSVAMAQLGDAAAARAALQEAEELAAGLGASLPAELAGALQAAREAVSQRC